MLILSMIATAQQKEFLGLVWIGIILMYAIIGLIFFVCLYLVLKFIVWLLKAVLN